MMVVAVFEEKNRRVHCSHLLLGSARLLACSGRDESFLPQAAHTRVSRYASKYVYKEKAPNTMTLLCWTFSEREKAPNTIGFFAFLIYS